MKFLYHLGKFIGLVQSSYIPTGIKESTVGESTPCRVWLTSVICPHLTTNDCSSDVGFRNNFFYRMGLLAPYPTLLFYPGLGPAGYTQTELDIPRRSGESRL